MKYKDPTESAFRDLSVIKFLDINKYLTARFMYQYHHNKLPVIFSDYFRQIADVHEHNTRQCIGLYAVPMKTDLGLTCISHRGPVIWNEILKILIQTPLRLHLWRPSNNAYSLICYKISKRMRDDINWYRAIIMWKFSSLLLWYSSLQGHIIVEAALE